MAINKKTFDFLKQLKKNNNREWFNKNKPLYQEALKDFTDFVEELIIGIASFDETIIGLDPKKCIFRIYRDIRFSKDKTPYKTYFSARLIGGNSKCGAAGYYIHLQPSGTLLAGGIHAPEPILLKVIREEITYNSNEFKEIISAKTFKTNFKEIWGEKLKTAPKDFDKEDPMIEYLRFKDFIIKHNVADGKVLARDFVKHCTIIYKTMLPFNNFVNAPVKELI